MGNKLVVLPIHSLAEAQREIERLAREIEALVAEASTIPVSPVSSVFGRGGAVVAQAGDYDVSQVTNAASDADVTAEAAARIAADTAEATARDNADALLIPLTQKGAASGVAELDDGTKIPASRIPNTAVTPGTYGDATNVPQLAVDATGRITGVSNVAITGGGGGGSGTPMAYCRVRKSTGGTVSSGGAFNAFPFDTEDADASGMHSTVTNTTRVTIVTAGRYVIAGEWTNAVLTNGYCGIQIRKNGTIILASHGVGYNNSGGVALTTGCVADLVAGDYLEMGYVSGIATSYDATTHSPRLEVIQIPTTQGPGTVLPVWSPHKAPVTPNALDVEFASSAVLSAWPAGWVASGGGDFPNPIFPLAEPGRFSTTNNVAGWKGRVAAIPAGDFNLAAYVEVYGPNTNFTLAQIGLQGNATIGGTGWTQFYAGYHSTIGGLGLGIENSAGTFLKNWGPNHGVVKGLVLWLRRVGGNAFFGWSTDGLNGAETGPHAVSGHTNISIGAYNQQSGVVVIRWVRVISTSGARQLWGGLVG
jgi:hypothetical protein